jgi:fumarylacetoacetase
MTMGVGASSSLRAALSIRLRDDSRHAASLQSALVPQSRVTYALPAHIGDFTDFYSSIHHATTVGRQYRPDNPLLPNYQWIPIAYHGRSSSIGVSEHLVRRPMGQSRPENTQAPRVSASSRLDFELEVGVFIGQGNLPGVSIPIRDAEKHIFGLCLLNDWSARDLQGWEYQPLGPFLSKNFATTISPWIVTLEALAPFRLPFWRLPSHPAPLPYLDDASVRERGVIDLQLEVLLESQRMRKLQLTPQRIAATNFRDAYWTIAQMVTHHAINGCNLRSGDLLGSGTQSGPFPGEAGSLLELSEGGKKPLTLTSSESRHFLEDGDRVILRGWCQREGCTRIGFGVASGTILTSQLP